MDELAFVISLTSLLVIPLVAYVLLKNTLFDITYLRDNPWPLLWYFTLATVLVPLVIVSALGIENTPGLYKAQPGTESLVALITITTLIEYIVALAFSLKLFKLRFRRDIVGKPLSEKRLHEVAFALTLFGLLILMLFYLLGYKHAFLSAFLEKRYLIRVRLANKYASHVPSQIAAILPLVGYILCALAGYIGRKKLLESFGYLAFGILFLSAPGDKAPPIWGIIIWVLAQGALLPKRMLSVRSVIGLGLILMVSVGGLYLAVSIQMPGMTRDMFLRYLLVRLGLGQMAGVYETIGLIQTNSLPEGNFYLHMIPGVRFITHYIDYQKALMMITEGYGYTEMGVKNTLFIAEAWAIGGLWFALFSPIIVGLSTAIGLLVLIPITRRIVGRKLAPSFGLFLYLKTHNITGGFSSFPLFKGLILMLGYLSVIIVWYYLFIVGRKVLASSVTIIKKSSQQEFEPRVERW